MHVLLHSVPLTLQQATTNPHLHQRLPDTHRQVFCGGHCSFLLGPCAQGSVVPSKSISQSYVSSGSSMVGLMETSSKRTYAIPMPRAPVPAADHCQPVPPQEMLKHSSVSASVGVPGSWCTQVYLSPLSDSGGNGV